jgi:hypothetical protein
VYSDLQKILISVFTCPDFDSSDSCMCLPVAAIYSLDSDGTHHTRVDTPMKDTLFLYKDETGTSQVSRFGDSGGFHDHLKSCLRILTQSFASSGLLLVIL